MPTTQELINTLNKELSVDALVGSDHQLSADYWPTGLLPVDALLGGGFQKGRMSLLAGESATLKSMIGLAAAGQVIAAGGSAAIIDTEHAFNPAWAESMGVDIDKLIISRPQTGESAIDQMEVLIRNDIDYICMDSIASLLPKAERELMLSGKDNLQPARIAALMSVGLRKLNSANVKTTIVWISQKRDNIGAMAFSPKTVVTGGKAIHYYISQSVMLTKVGKISVDRRYYDGEKEVLDKQIVVQKFKAELAKARNTQPFQVQHFNFDLVSGRIDDIQYLVQQGLDMGIITKNAAMWEITIVDPTTGEILFNDKIRGQEAFKIKLSENQDMCNALKTSVVERWNLDPERY